MNHRVLIVEDEDLLSSAFSVILEKDGYDVKVVRNGKDALKIIPVFKPEIVFLDLMMPEMGGIEFLETYKPSGEPAPAILVLSNLQDTEVLEKARKLGIKDFIIKSQITPEQMCKLAKRALA